MRQLIAELNPEQRAAVVHRGGPMLVLAGAGTGKTRVITVRIASLVVLDEIPPEHVLALTFTNKAAGEMHERIAQFLGKESADRMTVGTFHSLGLRMVERDAKKLGFRRGLTLLDAADQASAIRNCLKNLKIDPKRHDPRAFLTTISNARNSGLTPEDFLDGPRDGSTSQLTGRVFEAYLKWLEAYQAMDFDDLILRANQLLREVPESLEKWRRQFQVILVDEYQDTNLAQLEMTRRLADEHRQLTVVGDDDQSIYGWRGADVTNILEFERHFPDATAVALTRNYRSTGHILAAANAVIGNNRARREKSLWTDVGDGEPVRVVTAKDPGGEASYVAAEIVRRKEEDNRHWKDFGVLFRTSAQAKPIEEAFRLAGVPYRLVGAFEFFERKEIKDMLSYLRLCVAPHDEISMLRVINFPQRAIGPGAVAALHHAAHEHGLPLWEVLRAADTVPKLTAPQVESLQEFVKVVDDLRKRYAGGWKIADLVVWLCERLGAREAWLRDPTEGPGGEGRWRNVESLVDGMRGWQDRKPQGELRDYLRVVALDSRDAGGDAGDDDKVALLTLHAAKGLEWPFCFVIGCQEGIIPHQRTIESEDGDLAEERRLFYVGITRARRICYLTLAKGRYTFHGTEPTRPSRFIREVPVAHRVEVDRLKAAEPLKKNEVLDKLRALRERLGKR